MSPKAPIFNELLKADAGEIRKITPSPPAINPPGL